jgi:hypothetical protein
MKARYLIVNTANIRATVQSDDHRLHYKNPRITVEIARNPQVFFLFCRKLPGSWADALHVDYWSMFVVARSYLPL